MSIRPIRVFGPFRARTLLVAAVLAALMGGCEGGGGGDPDGSNEGSSTPVTPGPEGPDDGRTGPDPNGPPDDEATGRVVRVEAGLNGRAPASELEVPADATRTIAFEADAGYRLASVTGCEGTLADDGYRVAGDGPDCVVLAGFAPIAPELTVDVFGEGRVLQAEAEPCGARETCARRVTADETLTLLAEPAEGWRLSHWRGCDAVDDAACLVTVGEDRLIGPIFAREGEPRLADDVRVLDPLQLDAIQTVESGLLTFAPTLPRADAWSIGDVLVSTRDEGFARRITRIARIPGSPVLVQTREVSLSDVVEEGTLVWDGALEAEQLAFFVPAEGVEILEEDGRRMRASLGVSFTLDREGRQEAGTGEVSVTGQIELTLDPLIAMDFSFGRVRELNVGAGARIAPSLALDYRVPLTGFEVDRRIGQYVLPPVLVGPVVFVPSYSLFIDLKTGADATLRLESGFSVAGTASMRYRRGEGISFPSDLDARATPFGMSADATLSGELFLGVDMDFLIYRLTGPFLRLGPEFGFRSSSPVFGDRVGCVERASFVGGRGELGGRIELLGWELAVPSHSLAVRRRNVERNATGEARCRQDEPPAPTALDATLLADNAIRVHWDESSNGAILKYIVYRDGRYLDDTFGGELVDRTTRPDTRYCYTVAALDADGQSSTIGDGVCRTTVTEADTTPPETPVTPQVDDISTNSASIRWSPVADEGETVEYLVLLDGVVVGRLPETSFELTQLSAVFDYCVEVAAIDDAGNASTPSAPQCFQTLAPAQAEWRLRMGCSGQPYLLENRLDLSEAVNGGINVAGEGLDYDGTPLAYIIAGRFEEATRRLQARITFTAPRLSTARVDLFEADLSAADTGDIAADQVEIVGCPLIIRFDRQGAAIDARTERRAPRTGSGYGRLVAEGP